MDHIIAIHQPNFFPWLGYFSKIKQVDKFVFLDDVQVPKTGGGYYNRTSINMLGSSKIITAPILRSSGLMDINEVFFVKSNWKIKMMKTLQANYAKAQYFKKYKDFIFTLIDNEENNLSKYNINLIQQLSNLLDLKVEFIISSDLKINSISTQRLVDINKRVDGSSYLSGFGGDNYQETKLFDKYKIDLIYSKFLLKNYQQLHSSSFIGGLSIIDALFNLGEETKFFL